MTKVLAVVSLAFILSTSFSLAALAQTSPPIEHTKAGEFSDEFDLDAIVSEAADFFGVASEELAKVLAKAFKEHGRPNAFIKGTEAAGAIGIGLRVGQGSLHSLNGVVHEVKWEGPSIGIDIGINASKVLMLVYKLRSVDELYQKFSGVEGSVYIVAGVGVNYLKAGNVVVAPIRAGVGWRQGANIGFVRFSPRGESEKPI